MRATSSSRPGWIVLAILSLVQFGLMFRAAQGDAAIVDEVAHIPAGYGYVTLLDYRLNPEHPPLVKALAALPLSWMDLHFPNDRDAWSGGLNAEWQVGRQFLFDSGNNADRIVLVSRIAPILLTILTTGLIYVWSSRLFGNLWGLMPAVLFGLSPHVLAHGHYVTTDVAAAFGVVLATFFFLRWLEDPSWTTLVLAGLAFGVAQLCKFSAVLLVPYFTVLTACWVALHATNRWRRASMLAGVVLIGYLVVVYPTYFLLTRNYPITLQATDTAFALSTYEHGPTPAGATCRLQRCPADLAVWMSRQPILRPMAQYGLGALMVAQRTAEGGKTYWLGRVAGRGSRAYFPIVYVLKEPLPVLILIFVSLAYGLRRDFSHFALAFWVLFYWLTSMRSPLNIGFRHLIPSLPFAYMLVASSWRQWSLKSGRVTVGLLAVLLLWFVGETLAASPYFLSSFNELGGGTREGYRYVTDSNFDWGQDALRLRQFVLDHPEIDRIAVDYFGGAPSSDYLRGISAKEERWSSARGNPTEYGIHWLAVSVNALQSAVQPAASDLPRAADDEYRWLTAVWPRARGLGGVPRPDFRAGTSIFIYRLP
ncbi:MAG: glycosyltransferase family 39 protein [Acidobacteria bacterium]|nr:glycosyltransferase family 39 protein [Acidobacteriota bacterium]